MRRGASRPQGGAADIGAFELIVAIAPSLSISYSVDTVTLDWPDADNQHYDVYRSMDPYGGYAELDGATDLAMAPATDTIGTISGYYYYVQATSDDDDTAESGFVGVFHFDLTPGDD